MSNAQSGRYNEESKIYPDTSNQSAAYQDQQQQPQVAHNEAQSAMLSLQKALEKKQRDLE